MDPRSFSRRSLKHRASRSFSSATAPEYPNFISTMANSFMRSANKPASGWLPKSGMNTAFGDILIKANARCMCPTFPKTASSLRAIIYGYQQQGTSGDTLEYENLARDFGVELFGMELRRAVRRSQCQRNCDARPLSGEWLRLARPQSQLLVRLFEVAGGNSAIIGDAKNWPAF